MEGCHFSATFSGLASFILHLAALGSPHWLETLDGPSIGLWKICEDSPEGVICTDMGMNVKGYIHGTRAFLIMGLFPGSVSCILLFLLYFRSAIGSYSIQQIAMKSALVAGFFDLIAMCIFTGYWGSTIWYGWSVFLGWSSVAMFYVTGILSIGIIATYTPI